MQRREFLKLGGAVAATSVLPASLARARVSGPDISIRWLGAAMMELNIGGLRLLTDPCLGEGEAAFEMGDPNEMFDLQKGPNIKTHRRLTPFPGLGFSDYDAVLLSHAHEDHFDQAAQAWLGGQGPVVSPAHDTAVLRAKGFAAETLAHGASRSFVSGETRVKITAIPAVHSQSPRVAGILGLGNGYWIEATVRGRVQTLYWAGDTFHVDPVLQDLDGRSPPDLFIPHIGAVGGAGALGLLSLTGQQAIDFAARIQAPRMLPIHHSTYELYQEPVSALVQAQAARGGPLQLEVIGEGAALRL